MQGLGITLGILLLPVVFCACSDNKPVASTYKDQLQGASPAGPAVGSAADKTPGTQTPGATPPAGTAPAGTAPAGTAPAGTAPAAVTGNAQSGLAILGANCETAGCHKTNGITLTKASVLDAKTAAKTIHQGVQPVFSDTNIADMKAALSSR